jgi:DNA-directed RNA polymerase specialized sigma24 family protein
MAGRRRGEDAAIKAMFFTALSGVAYRQYEALRAHFVEGLSAAQAAARFGYAPPRWSR